MPDRYEQLEALITSLADVQTQQRVGGALSSARREPQSAEAQLKQVDRVLEAFQILGKINQDDPRNLNLLMTLGRTYDQFAHVEKALDTYSTALSLAERLGDVSNRAELLRRMGKANLRLRRWQEGMDLLGQSLAIYELENDASGQARVLMNQGIALHEQGNYEGAEKAYREAVRLGDLADDGPVVADAESNLAVLATGRGDLDEALAQYRSCLLRFEALNDPYGQARAYHNMGMTHADKEDWREASLCYEKAFDIAHGAGLLDVVANVYLSRTELMLELGDTSMAATYCTMALDIYRETGDTLGEADSYRLLGNVFTRRKQWATAEALFQDSIRLNMEFDNPLNVAETHRDLGRLYASRGQKMKAEEIFIKAREGFERLGAQTDVNAVNELIAELM